MIKVVYNAIIWQKNKTKEKNFRIKTKTFVKEYID